MTNVQRQHDEWLHSGLVEEALDPCLRIVDPHHHLWYKLGARPHVATYMIDELSRDIERSGHNIIATVYMQSSSAKWRRAGGPEDLRVLGESELMQGVAMQGESGLYGQTRVCAGIIATANLLLGSEVEPVLRAHQAVARNFRGVRFLGGRAEQIPFSNPKLVEAAQVLASLGLDLDVNGPEMHPLDFTGVLGGIAGLAEAVPSLTIILDHCGGAIGPTCLEERPASLMDWRDGIRKLAACPNVVVKLGGLHMPVNGFALGPEQRPSPISSEELAELLLPTYQFVIDAFGAQRCMFESNFPVDKWGVSYGVLWNTFKRVADTLGLSKLDREAIFQGTAVRIYRLELPADSGD